MSIRRRTWTTSKGEERSAWMVDYTDQNGKRRAKSFRLKKDAEAFALTAGVEVREGVHVADRETVTVAEAGKLWISSGTAAGLERTTLDQRRQHLELHLTPFLGAVRLNKLTVPAVRAFQDDLREAGRSAAMVARVTVSLGSILSDAQERGLVVRNAVHEMKSRRKGKNAAQGRHRARLRYGVDIPTREEVRAIVGASQGRSRPLLLTAVFTGLRSSELRGLPWSAVDLDRGTLDVIQRADRYQTVGMPKSDAGHRTIPLPPLVINALRRWKLACPKGKLDLVFPNGAGNLEYHANIIKRVYHPAQIEAGVTVEERGAEGETVLKAKYTGLHALRHWYASWCINRKADGGLELSPKQVQARMGHSSITVTYDTYGHLFPATDETEALAAAEHALLAADAT
ncbi:MAG: site-specific integrase [Stappia sp.]|uniref:tyrosine-type recombinase/integrase n=1 Tax=Stappia sp. TaxID=1870903 RepID=UPI000C6192B1|nr:site-specific integrase [Stappia sp.]MAA98686.1 site-specific integrase [Stappia sp.]MBM20484.1 site-specific integrase [Stappia sp.]|tara:strand:+ start:1549 stop:2748 length:1200 start_codon:yes stop_codon:yes gene_type:complete